MKFLGSYKKHGEYNDRINYLDRMIFTRKIGVESDDLEH